ncbi:MAG TPA: EF-hand domain-containing protein [Burkholderiaceae bacterium]|nr:EF-hand domain-containing protein [Burkholderiaceae bacterium]
MSSISGIGGGNADAWSGMSSARAGSRADRMFAKVDADGSGSVDSTELQGMLDHISETSGTTLGSADDLMKTMDADGNGTLDQSELADGMKSLMPPPSSTVDFAQGRGGMPPPPPPEDGGGDGMSCSGDDSSSSDGTSATGDLASQLDDLFSAIDTDGDKSISDSEAQTFQQNVQAALDSSSTDAAQQSLSSFIEKVLQQYAQNGAATATSSSDCSVSVSA